MAEEGSGSQINIITRHEGPNQVIHIRTDSNGILDELFKGVQNPKTQNTVPLRDRNLPASFFIQPKTEKPPNPQPCVHLRSHSSPASITQTLSLPPQSAGSSVSQTRSIPQVAAPINNHFRQKSVPAPHSQPQYCPANLPDGRIVFQNKYTSEVVPDGPRIREQLFGPLPDGWAELKDDHGETYYVDHTTKSTSWFDPRLPEEVQKSSVYSRQQRSQSLSQQNGFAQNGMFSGASSARTISSNQQPVHSPQQSFSQSVNANPMPCHNQRVNFLSSSFNNNAYSQPSSAAAGLGLSHHVQQQSPSQTALLPQQGHTLYTTELEMEREMLKMRRREIQQQQLQKQQQMNTHLPMGHSLQSPTVPDVSMRRTPGDYDLGSPMSPVANMRHTDPFLGGYHGRQESGDSGFSASTPRTPENFLAQMDELSLYNEGWDVSTMNVTSVGAVTAPAIQGQSQQGTAMDCGQDEFADCIFNDLESVLGHTDSTSSSYTDITWV